MGSAILQRCRTDKVECLKLQNFIEQKMHPANTEVLFEAILEDLVAVSCHQSMN